VAALGADYRFAAGPKRCEDSPQGSTNRQKTNRSANGHFGTLYGEQACERTGGKVTQRIA